MTFRWDEPMLEERKAGEPPSLWLYVVLLVVVERVAFGLTVVNWPKGKSINSWEFARGLLLIGPAFWGALCAFIYHSAHGQYAFETAVTNQEAWQRKRSWLSASRSGVGVLDSVVLAPEPDLAERMLALEGTPPENPGKVMALQELDGSESRLHLLLEMLLGPIAPKLAVAMRSESFQLMMQGDRDDSSDVINEVWKKLELPGFPRIIRMQPDTMPKFAEKWFQADADPRYRLVLAWHLNDGGPNAPQEYSEFGVALLLGSHQLMWEKRDKLRGQAWLLRGIETEADRVEVALTQLLKAEQVESKRIRNFWHSRLKGLAQHATLGAVRDSELKVSTHALDAAIGPQAAASRWLVYALAAKMVHFGQGAQLVALPGGKGVMLNLAIKEPQGVDLPWKHSYGYTIVPFAEALFVCLFALGIGLLDTTEGWNGLDTASVVVAVLGSAGFFAARYFRREQLLLEYWRVLHESSS
ncbi:MAG TPA: hypothetical protein VF534_15445 [Paraburkholderia sp.]